MNILVAVGVPADRLSIDTGMCFAMTCCVDDSPAGTAEVKSSNGSVVERFSRPDGTGSSSWTGNPAMNRWAIIECLYGTAAR
ncbi:MAG: hypothetical protein IID41_01410 [Planctomycetes bacterium]|nr:hypothetical protein [Planctomycetota bacterium]